ncbi:MAG TPA: glycosyltransferase family 39 protein [Roseiflexaceae bacterium]|nr:glycosyltransferase family 39 protein [Roseiflexaceae bacterium]
MVLGPIALALGLRLLVWRWHEPYPLGGDETEYFNQALTLLREHRYVELQLMRPPLYTAFLAACIYFFDSLVQRLRLIQEIISALTIVPIYALTWELFRSRRVAFVAALLTAMSYTMAANATELLTETVFLFGLSVFFWLLLKATNDERRTTNEGQSKSLVSWSVTNRPLAACGWAALAGLALGLLLLVRSVALPLLPLGALWLWRRTTDREQRTKPSLRASLLCSLLFVLCSLAVVAPWTARNYITYGAPILIDTTGAENLWLDNNPSQRTPQDPLGREAAKRQLYALGDDRAARQSLATRQGLAEIRSHPDWFAAKAWGEIKQFFALQYFDDMRARREIWVPPLEVWLRLLLGDGLWLVLLLAGAAGLWLAPIKDDGRWTMDDGRTGAGYFSSFVVRHPPAPLDFRWIAVPWALYIVLTSAIFHVELRYRLPVYPVLLPYAAWCIAALHVRRSAWPRAIAAALTVALLVGVTLLHRPYVRETVALAQKHYWLWQAEQALAAGQPDRAAAAAQKAWQYDPESVLALVDEARAALLGHDYAGALHLLNQAIDILPNHPQARVLRGAVLRAMGRLQEARKDLAYETASLEDVQRWAWRAFAPARQLHAVVDVGKGLDLGYVLGFGPSEQEGFRWSSAESSVLLDVPPGANRVVFRLAPGRPAGAPAPTVTALANGQEIGHVTLANGWRTYSMPLPSSVSSPLVLTLRSDTFRPRAYDKASADNRTLGVMVSRVEVTP